ncbi:MAG TPA: hypothetical protein VFZ26_04500 [Gemmatimonadales bacterium]
MSPRSALTFAAAALLLAGCNKPAPTPEAAAPANATVDTVAAAGAPVADTVAVMDSIAENNDSIVADTAVTDTTLDN